MTRPRNQRAGHPPWCVRDQQSTIGRHVSAETRVGRRRPGHLEDRGEVGVWLSQTNGGPVWVRLVAAHMVSASVEISVEDAVVLRDGLTELLRQAAL